MANWRYFADEWNWTNWMIFSDLPLHIYIHAILPLPMHKALCVRCVKFEIVGLLLNEDRLEITNCHHLFVIFYSFCVKTYLLCSVFGLFFYSVEFTEMCEIFGIKRTNSKFLFFIQFLASFSISSISFASFYIFSQ